MHNHFLNTYPGICELLASFTADYIGQDASPETVAEDLATITLDMDEDATDDAIITAYVEKHLGYIA